LDKCHYSQHNTITITITITNTINTTANTLQLNTVNSVNTVNNSLENGYSLDNIRTLRVLHLEFIDSFSSLLLDSEKYSSFSILERYNLVRRVIEMIDSSTNKGFIPSHDLTKFPLFSELLPAFLLDSSESAVLEYQRGSQSMESYKWLYNLLFLSLYLFCIETLALKELVTESEDLVHDIRELEGEIYGRLDPSIRAKIQKKGISIKENTYVGFDTEFTKQSSETNTLVSSQLAVTTKTYVQIPKNTPYFLSTLDVKTNKTLRISTQSSVLNYPKIESSIQMCIAKIRKIKYGKNDECLLVLIECLRLIRGLSYDEKADYIVFSLPRSVIQPYIHFGDSFSFKELIEVSASISKPYLEQSTKSLMNLITSISSNNFTLMNGKDRLLEEIYKIYSDYKEIEDLGAKSEQPLPFLQTVPEVEVEKRLSRCFLMDFSERMSVTKTKTYYIIAHLTPADLSLLSDFEEYKDEISIVNGSFVTIGKPLIICGRSTHIRDTMLLAPGGSRALASIGRLYGEVFNKISIRKEDLEDMQGFLERDRAMFIEYALRDALISLVHAS